MLNDIGLYMWNINVQKYIEYHRYDQNAKKNAEYKLEDEVQTKNKQLIMFAKHIFDIINN